MLKPEYVYTDVVLAEPTRTAAITEISKRIAAGNAAEEKQLKDTFFAREELDSTGCGYGVAIPHAKIDGLTEPKVEVFKFRDKIDWDAIDGEPVQIAIALVMPNNDKDNLHLQVVSKLARKLCDQSFVKALEDENNAAALHKLLIDNIG